MSLKQKPDQSPTEFAREIEAAGRTYFIGVPENFIQQSLFDVFVKGLHDTDALYALKYTPVRTLEAALEIVINGTAVDIPSPVKKVRLTGTTTSAETSTKQQPEEFTKIQMLSPKGEQSSSYTTNAPSQAYKKNAFNTPPHRGRGRPRGCFPKRGRGRGTQGFRDSLSVCYKCRKPGHIAATRRSRPGQWNFENQGYKTAVTWYNQPYPPPQNPFQNYQQIPQQNYQPANQLMQPGITSQQNLQQIQNQQIP